MQHTRDVSLTVNPGVRHSASWTNHGMVRTGVREHVYVAVAGLPVRREAPRDDVAKISHTVTISHSHYPSGLKISSVHGYSTVRAVLWSGHVTAVETRLSVPAMFTGKRVVAVLLRLTVLAVGRPAGS
jgi:hypothetical protein